MLVWPVVQKPKGLPDMYKFMAKRTVGLAPAVVVVVVVSCLLPASVKGQVESSGWRGFTLA